MSSPSGETTSPGSAQDAPDPITFKYLSQEDILAAGGLDFPMIIEAAESAMLAERAGSVMFPDKIVQIFDEDSQSRINCLPATLLDEKVCGVKWVSVFPPSLRSSRTSFFRG